MKYLIASLVFIFSIAASFAQTVEISEAPRAIENSTQNSYLFEIANVDKNFVQNEWEDFMKKPFKAKTKKDKATGFLLSSTSRMSELSSKDVNVYSQLLEDKSPALKTSVIVWFKLGENSYVSSETDSAKGKYVHQLLTEFAIKTARKHAESIVKAEEKNLSGLEKDLKNLEKDQKDYEKEIAKAKDIIAKNEKNIETNAQEQQKKASEIAAQKEVVQKAKAAVQKIMN